MEKAKSYPTDLSDAQWDLIKDYFNCRRKRKHTIRGVIDAILYVLHSDTNWRMLPREFAPWQTVYYYYDKWTKSGLWDRVMELLPDEVRPAARPSSPAVLNWSSARSIANRHAASYPSLPRLHPATPNHHVWQMAHLEEEHPSSKAA